MTRASTRTRDLCYSRALEISGGACEVCGERSVGSLHRRVTPGHGGRRGSATKQWEDDPANHLAVCGSGTTYCHGMMTNPYAFPTTRATLEAMGWVVARNGGVDPATVPVRTTRGFVLLDHDGGWIPCPSPT